MAKQYRGWARFSVRNLDSADLDAIIELANEFKYALVCLYYDHHCDTIDLRNSMFPEYWQAIQDFERSKLYANEHNNRLKDCDQAVGWFKHLISEAKKANQGVKRGTPRFLAYAEEIKELKHKLEEAKAAKAEAVEAAKKYEGVLDRHKAQKNKAAEGYSNRCKAYGAAKKARSEAMKAAGIIGPNDGRRKTFPWPEYPADSFEHKRQLLDQDFDLKVKSLGEAFQKRGLHCDIRGEVSKAVEAMKFKCCKPPHTLDISPCNSISLQLKQNAKKPCPTFAELEARGWGNLLQIQYEGTGAGKNRDCFLYHVSQNIGTDDAPCHIKYDVLIHREWPDIARLQRWTLVLGEKPYVTPILSTQERIEPTDKKFVTNDYSAGRRRKDGGLSVAHFLGEEVNEEVYLPKWLVDKFETCYQIDAAIAESCQRLLNELGIKESGWRNKIYQAAETSQRAQTWLEWEARQRAHRKKIYQQAANARRHIFHVAAYRIAKGHTHLIEDPVNIAELKRNKTRDRKKSDHINDDVRRRSFIASPGELRRILRQSGLDCSIEIETSGSSRICPECGNENLGNTPKKKVKCEHCPHEWDRDLGACLAHAARAGVSFDKAVVARNTDLFTSYVENMGVKTGSKPYVHVNPSWKRRRAVAA